MFVASHQSSIRTPQLRISRPDVFNFENPLTQFYSQRLEQ